MQNLENGWQQILKTGRFALPYSRRARACYVDYRDVAECAALAFTDSRLDYGTFELCAAGMLDRIELTALMSEVLGRPIEAAELPFEEWAQNTGLPEGPLREGLKRMYAHYDQHGFPGGNELVLRSILGREPRDLRQYIQELARRERTAA